MKPEKAWAIVLDETAHYIALKCATKKDAIQLYCARADMHRESFKRLGYRAVRVEVRPC